MTPRVRFGIFDFDPATRELRRDGVAVRLQGQPAQVLAALVEHAGEVVTREQLRQALWGTDTFVDFDRGLNYCIAQIRSALGDSADSPRFVRTIPKLGYQFVAPVSAPAAVAEPPAAPAQPNSSSKATRYVFAAVLVAVLGAAATYVVVEQRPKINIAVARFDNETGSPEMTSFADGLTDVLVAELTAGDKGRYGVIGNAELLRQPRAQRDLKAIGTSLNAAYVVLGQVQRDSSHIRVLAHLIRLPQQTHLKVVRFDQDLKDPLPAESELAHRIATEFFTRLDASPRSAKN